MKTEDLIKLIAADADARRWPMSRSLALAALSGCVVAGVAMLASLGIRPDLRSAVTTWRFDAKLLALVLFLAVAWNAAYRLSHPQADSQRTMLTILMPLATLVSLVTVEFVSTPASTWAARALGTNSRVCLIAILAFSLGPFAILLTAMREGAPRSPQIAGAAAGLLAGCIGAVAYAVHCPDDSPFFVAIWYSPPILLMTMAGAGAGARLLRW